VACFHSVSDLIAAIEEYLRVHNSDPTPFVWTATAEQILEKVHRARAALAEATSGARSTGGDAEPDRGGAEDATNR
jgi:hypothetical protein